MAAVGAVVSVGSADTVINAFVQQFGATPHTLITSPNNVTNVQIDWKFNEDFNKLLACDLTFDHVLPNNTVVICKLSGHDSNPSDHIFTPGSVSPLVGLGNTTGNNSVNVSVPVKCDPGSHTNGKFPQIVTGNFTDICDVQDIDDVKVIVVGKPTCKVIDPNNPPANCATPPKPTCEPAADTDGDGLLDCWEIFGIDQNGDGIVDLNLPALGANPLHKDIFVEVDYMEFHQPRALAMADVVTAFNNAPVSNPDGTTGINMHIQVDEQVPHDDDLSPVWTEFDAIKATNFGTLAERSDPNAANILAAKRLAFHYSLFAHQYDGGGSSGRAELPGNDFLVTLGAVGWGLNDAGTHTVGSRAEQAGTFMHELGHNLNLHHGGADDVNFKPDYLSVMSYAFQVSFGLFGNPLDYSQSLLPILDEASLSEPAGIGASTPPSRNSFNNLPCPGIYPTGVPVDWNCDTDTVDVGVVADINGDTGISALAGYDDWSNLLYDFKGTPDFADGSHVNETPTEATPADIAAFESRIFPGGPG